MSNGSPFAGIGGEIPKGNLSSGIRVSNKVSQAVEYLKDYINTYPQTSILDDGTQVKMFIEDILYGLGVSLHPESYKNSNGFKAFKEDLFKYLENRAI